MDVLGLPLREAVLLLEDRGYFVETTACDARPPEEADSARVVAVRTEGNRATLLYGMFKTQIEM